MSFVEFTNANSIGNRFLSLLSNHGIQPPLGSSLEDELLSLTQLIEVMENPNLAQGAKGVTILRAAAGMHDFAAKVLSVEPLPDFPRFLPHLRLIAETQTAAASLAQNVPSAHNDDTVRKMAELYMGCLAAHVGIQVVFDSPTNSKGDNPDVIFTVEECFVVRRPQRWALAIKTISSRHGQTIFERIKEGASQIDRCHAEKGLVVINAKGALNHDSLWNTVFLDEQSAKDALANQLDTLAESANENRPREKMWAVFLGKAVRPVLFLGQSLVRLLTPVARQTPTALKMLRAYDANGTLDPVGYGLAYVLNDLMQTVLLGIPGGLGQPPR